MDEIAVGLIGYGLAGSVFHVPIIQAVPRLRIAGVASSRADDIARDLPGVRRFGSPEQLITDPEIELIVVATPNTSHFALGRAALLAAKPVVIDKPIATTSAEAAALINLAVEQDVLLSTYQNRRWDNDFLTLRAAIDDGRLGEISYCEARYDRFRLSIKPGWREESLPGSGILFDLGSHLIDQALLLFGSPSAVAADLAAQRPGALVADYFHLILHYPGRRAILHASTLAPGPGPHFTVHGDRASFVKFGMDSQEQALRDGRRPGADPDWGSDIPENFAVLTTAGGARETLPTVPGAYQRFYEGIAAAILDGAPVPVDPSDALLTLRVIEAAYKSASERRTIEFS